MVLDITFPPIQPLPPGEQRPTPTSEELDALFAKIAEQAAEPIGMVRILLGGISSFMLGNKALLELLIAKGVIDEESREQVGQIANEMNVRTGRQSVRDFIGFAAKGLVKVGGKPLPPDDVATLISMFVDDEPDFGAALATMTKSVLPADHLAAFYAKAAASEEPFKVLCDYRVHEDPAEAKVNALTKKVEELAATSFTMMRSVARLSEADKVSRERITNLMEADRLSREKIVALEAEVEKHRKEAEALREEVAAFRSGN